ncbi:asparaginase [Aestuariirhabdus litorea]|uniref:asparaginase n=1 Tax=Aestuariirhabdus litorea TaxID=2528527 RepID=A0A3P3VI84_9GAMM|nr:asparaginase [Aestuariirhabdus litorea]RRJ82382.1 L-asparaginase 1 [Aestuariirhabdus litorea]RWW92545.1 L-asparaginase 1 [Endozoicomonadaceae bacterium GTF-13]
MKKRIYIAYTGGTIGMHRSPKGYVVMPGFARLIEEKIPPRLSGEMPDYDLHEYPNQIDSSNIVPADWLAIARDIASRYHDYDGFVVLHGTDTMAYTASALSFMLQGLAKPVIVTGSQIPLSETRNDAQDNLVTAIELACGFAIPEVCLYFNGRLLRGNRSLKVKATGFDAFDSPNYPWLAQIGIHIEPNHNALMKAPAATRFELPDDYATNRVIPIQLFPGISGELIDAVTTLNCRGLILRSYGVGNAPDNDPGLLNALARANARGTIILNLSQCLQGGVHQGSYATGSALSSAGVISGGDMTLEAAFTKLHHLFACGLEEQKIRELMARNLCGELSEHTS